ncbi:MAG: zinc/iron-chelating domain-containing protein [Deltaproteobacteria bacterium HGW-Deltaproteobacteria-4]|nr:MAG: zinc/iron-chelating domain-containing protein [Deltaproteobacteria bacterium HGW-Deltaproteobacteria-4]
MHELLRRYRALLTSLDQWFAAQQGEMPNAIVCADGCSGCCRGLFDISLLDACLLRAGFDQLPAVIRAGVVAKAETRLVDLQERWPGFSPPYLLNHMDDSLWTEMPENDLTPCPLLDPAGRCLVYAYRPMTCRLHGLPQIDLSGEIFLGEWCSRNFIGLNPLEIDKLRHDFQQLFTEEFILLRAFAKELCGLDSAELDTFIPLAMLIDFDGFDWQAWGEQQRADFHRAGHESAGF